MKNTSQGSGSRGINWVDVLIVLAIVGLIIIIATPKFYRESKQSQEQTCINNLTQIERAKAVWAAYHPNDKGEVTMYDLVPWYNLSRPPATNGYLLKALYCPAGGKYTVGRIGAEPTCTIPGHVLPGKTKTH